jgi:transcription elongation regulator 1
VEEELGEHLKERNREQERHKMQEHEQNFKALLTDLVRRILQHTLFNHKRALQIKNTDVSWHDARKLFKKDDRYQNCDLLEKEIKERIFRDHIRDLERKKRDKFYQVF